MSNRLAEIEQRQAAYQAYYLSDSDLWPTALRQALSDVDWLVAEPRKASWVSVPDYLGGMKGLEPGIPLGLQSLIQCIVRAANPTA
jgi:hypothetical protein